MEFLVTSVGTQGFYGPLVENGRTWLDKQGIETLWMEELQKPTYQLECDASLIWQETKWKLVNISLPCIAVLSQQSCNQ